MRKQPVKRTAVKSAISTPTRHFRNNQPKKPPKRTRNIDKAENPEIYVQYARFFPCFTSMYRCRVVSHIARMILSA